MKICTTLLLLLVALETTVGSARLNDVVFQNATAYSVHKQTAGNSLHHESHRKLFFNKIFSFFKSITYRFKVPELYRTIPKPPSHTQAIVIGSGFGGAVAALRLAQAGISTTVLERGQDWPQSPSRKIHATETLRDGRGLWQRKSVRTPIVAANAPELPVDEFGGVLDLTEYDNIEIWRGACVGGGSKVFTGVMIQPKEEYFNQIYEGLVSYDEMDQTYFPRVRSMLNLSPVPDDVYNSKYFAHRRLWDEQATTAGYTVERPDSIFNWDVVRDEIHGRSRKSAIVGESNMGNSNGAKFDVTQNYLKQAKETGKAKVYSNQKVTDITKTSSGYSVSIEKLSPSGKVVDRYTITSDYLFLAAGSIGTSELLVKAKAKGTVPNLNEHIGQGWGSNGDSIMTRSFSQIKGLNQASPCTSEIHDDSGVLPITVESWYVPGTTLDVGIQGSLGIAFDMENRGHFEYSGGHVKLVWPRDANQKAQEAARSVNDRIANHGSPRSFPGVPFLAPDVNTMFTAHPLGGAVLNKATDNYGRVKGASGLYVMDGAIIPGTTGAVNPSLTITAMAERNIEQIILEDF